MINLKFKKIIIHHFLSYDHAEIDLQDRGYCLVSGVNRNPKDASKSNGAGKSTAFNAISFALTGETLQGLKSNLSNIYFNDGCYVQLEMTVDGHEYVILRSKDDKKLGTDLKITVDGVDKSGKTLTESKSILTQLLPDLTSELLGSVIMLGQGMPMKFTANTPAGRKEVLEHLSHSDFMIQDIKDRLVKRQSELADTMQKINDKLLVIDSKESVYKGQLATAEEEYAKDYSVAPDYDSEINRLSDDVQKYEGLIKTNNDFLVTKNQELNDMNPKLLEITKEKENTVNKYSSEHQQYIEEFNTRKTDISSKKFALEQEITRLKSIKDVCPTCGQKIPGAVKPDTSKQEEQLQVYIKNLEELHKEITEDKEAFGEVLNKINNKYDSKIQELTNKVIELRKTVTQAENNISVMRTSLSEVNGKIIELKNKKEFFEVNKTRIEKNIQELKEFLKNLENDRTVVTADKTSVSEHVDVVNKMMTIVKRDFRGILLKSVIDYINAKAKEYASKVFGCDELEFILDGNNIDISFCNKDYENLSGGEKQRVDLIVQFAIRDFLCNYLQFSSNALVLDEITDALDAESCDRVMNFITTELKDIESVFIISHHASELAIPCDSEIVIEKNELGVSNVIH